MSIASSDHSDEDTVFNKEYEPSILAVLSGQIVAFPETKEPINGTPKINVYYLINPLSPSAPYFFYLSNARRFYLSMGKLCSLIIMVKFNQFQYKENVI